MTYEFYKLLHIAGILITFAGLFSLLALAWAKNDLQNKVKTFAFASHGTGLLLILLSGFGMLAKLGLAREIPMWAYGKIVVWILVASMISIAKRKGYIGWPIAVLFWGLGFTAAYLAVMKPF